MGASVGSSGPVKAEPNVVPMIDVMLVLLVIFMVVTPAIAAGFSAEPPKGANLKPHPEEETDQVLGIDRFGQYFLNKKKIENLTAEMTHISKYVIDYLIRGMSGEFGRSRFTREFSTKATGGSAPIAQ